MANFGICRGQKIKGTLGGIRSHMNRESESRTNPDIDPERTPDNYSLEKGAEHLQKRVNARIKELKLKKAPRKDAVKLVDFVVTASPEAMKAMSPEQQREYFKQGLEFLKEFYGEKNFMYCEVHMDEETPHAHVGVVPITKDGRLCAKEVTSRKELGRLQDEFYEKVCKEFALERGEKHDESKSEKRKHIETSRLKAETAEKRAEIAIEQEQSAIDYTQKVIQQSKLVKNDIRELKEVVRKARHKQGWLKDDKSKIEMSVADFERLQKVVKRATHSAMAFVELKEQADLMTVKAVNAENRANKAESVLTEERSKSKNLQKELTDFKTANKDFLSIPERYLPLAKEGIEEKRVFVKSTLHDLNKIVGALYLKTKSTDKVRKTLNLQFSDAHIKSCAKNFLHQVTDRAKPVKDKKDWSAPAPASTNYREPCSKNFNESVGSILDNVGGLPPNMASIPTDLQLKFEKWSLLSPEEKKKLLEEYELGRLI